MFQKIKDYFGRFSLNDYINFAVMGLAFSVPLSRTLTDFFAIAMTLLWLFEGRWKEKFHLIKDSNVIKSVALYMIFIYLSILWTRPDFIEAGLKFGTDYFKYILLLILIIATSVQKEFINKIIYSFLIAMFISEVLSYGIFFEWWEFNGRDPMNPTPIMHWIDYSVFLAFTSLLIFTRFFQENSFKMKLLYFVYFLFVTSNLFINGGRTGHIAFALSIFVVGFLNIKNKFVAFFSMLLLITVVLVTAYNVSPVFKARYDGAVLETKNIIEKSQYCGSWGLRAGVLIVGTEIFLDHPILGVGAGSATQTMYEYIRKGHPDKKCADNYMSDFHNDYMEVLVQTGLIGLILFLLIFYNLFKLKIHERSFENLKIIFLVIFMFSAIPKVLFNSLFPMALFALFVGIFIVMSQTREVLSNKERESNK